MSRREYLHLPLIHAHISAQLGRTISRVQECSGSGPTHDLEVIDGERPSVAIEVKELVPGEFLATSEAVDQDRGLDSETLAMRWSVLITEEPLSTRLAPMPNFPDDPPQDVVDSLSMSGFVLTTKRTLQEQWRNQHTLARRPQVAIRNLAKDLEPHLAVLERYGISETRCYALPTSSSADFASAHEAIWAIKSRTHDSICMAHDPIDRERPGVDLGFGYGSVRTGDADVLAERVQMWLDSVQSSNLARSLEASGADERHAALWLSTEAESESAREQGTRFCPAVRVRLPAEVNVLWVFVGPLVLRYSGNWTATKLMARTH